MIHSPGPILPSILANTQTPHQPFLVLQDASTCSGVPVLRQLITRNKESDSPIVLVSAVYSPEFLGLADAAGSPSIKVLDLTNNIPGFPSSSKARQVGTLDDIKTWIVDACKGLGRGVQVYIDDVNTLAEDYRSSAAVIKMVKEIVKMVSGLKAPSRLTVLSSTSGQLLPNLLSSSMTPTLTSVTIHPPEILISLHSAYLFPPPVSGDLSETGTTGGSRFRGILENATKRNENLRLALTGEFGTSVGEWSGSQGGKTSANHGSSNTSGEASSSSTSKGVVAEVLVRKAAGGASKGMLRTLEGLRPSVKGKERANTDAENDLEACRWQDIKGLESLASGYQVAAIQADTEGEKKTKQEEGKAHVDSTFNLGLTDAQRASRAEVPIPYAHEGDDAPNNKRYDTTHTGAGIIFEPGSDDDMDDDDPDDDLDF